MKHFWIPWIQEVVIDFSPAWCQRMLVPTKRKCSHFPLTTLILMSLLVTGKCRCWNRSDRLSPTVWPSCFHPEPVSREAGQFHWHAYLLLPSSGTSVSISLFNIWWLESENYILHVAFNFSRASACNKTTYKHVNEVKNVVFTGGTQSVSSTRPGRWTLWRTSEAFGI